MTIDEFYAMYNGKPGRFGVRSWVADKIMSAINFTGERIINPAPYPSFRDSLGRWIEGRLTMLWEWFYNGSEDEKMDGIEWALSDDVPFEYRSPRQQEIARHIDEFISTPQEVA